MTQLRELTENIATNLMLKEVYHKVKDLASRRASDLVQLSLNKRIKKGTQIHVINLSSFFSFCNII